MIAKMDEALKILNRSKLMERINRRKMNFESNFVPIFVIFLGYNRCDRVSETRIGFNKCN